MLNNTCIVHLTGTTGIFEEIFPVGFPTDSLPSLLSEDCEVRFRKKESSEQPITVGAQGDVETDDVEGGRKRRWKMVQIG